MTAPHPDPGDPRLTHGAGEVLGAFNTAGIVAAADVQIARRLGRLCAEDDPAVLLAAALAVRALRSGSVCVRLDALGDLALPEGEEARPDDDPDEPTLPWPAAAAWTTAVAASPLVARGESDPDEPRPLRLVGDRLYLDRYWRDERLVREDVDRRAGQVLPVADSARLTAHLERLFPDPGDDRQRLACLTAASGLLTVVTGGPGTGKTTVITRMIALLGELDPANPPRVALAAPTGKAAARLTETVSDQWGALAAAGRLPARLPMPEATTLHRLLGATGPGRGGTRFRHDRRHRLPHDVLVVDETSMVSLPLMARLLEAVRPHARLVLVGDPDQLASVEAGAVLADVAARLSEAPATASRVVRLERVHRFGGTLAALADAVREGDADRAVAVLTGGDDDVVLVDPGARGSARDDVVQACRARVAAAASGDAPAALAALELHRVLVAHRRGPHGLGTWSEVVRQWEADAAGHAAAAAVGSPVIVTANDAAAGVANGDTGVVLPGTEGSLVVAFGQPRSPRTVPLHRLGDLEPLLALTVHRSQGSQYDAVTVVLPPPDSPLLTRELLYTAVTRARRRVRVIGDAASVAAAVARPVRRASGLREAAISGPAGTGGAPTG